MNGDVPAADATLVVGEATEMVAIDDAPIGDDASRYEQIGMLGKGGMGEIRLCRDARIARQVAVKVLRGKLRDNGAARSRFLREARLQGQLEHPAIVPVHDLGTTDDGELFFTMKRVHGVTLSAAIAAIEHGDRTRFTRRRLLSAFSNVCLAVDFAHARGVVHRDLKPANIMLGDFGEVYVLDWGIAKVMTAGDTPLIEPIELPDDDTPTRAGTVLGTPRYMAPEQHQGHANSRSDVFALGRILSEILICEADAPPELELAAHRALAQQPEERFASARDLHEAVERFLDGDRDLEVRKRLADDHVRRAEQALERLQQEPTPEVRAGAAQDLGRALGMEPGNTRALRAFARLLDDVPTVLPPAAAAEMERRWEERGMRLMNSGVYALLTMLLVIPVFLWLGVRSWAAIGALVACIAGALAFHYAAGKRMYAWQRGGTLLLALVAIVVLSMSTGLLGFVPIALTIIVFAFRINVVSTRQGFAILVIAHLALVAPFVLAAFGVIAPSHEFRDGMIIVLPRLHDLPATETQVYVLGSSACALAIAILYARAYVRELRRLQARIAFHSWQLEQLVPPEPVLAPDASTATHQLRATSSEQRQSSEPADQK